MIIYSLLFIMSFILTGITGIAMMLSISAKSKTGIIIYGISYLCGLCVTYGLLFQLVVISLGIDV